MRNPRNAIADRKRPKKAPPALASGDSAFRRRALPLIAFLLLCALLPSRSPAASNDRNRISIDGTEIEYYSGDAGLANQASASLASGSLTIERRLGITLRQPVTIILTRSRAEFDALCGSAMPEWALAAALPEKNTIVADATRATPATANDLHLSIAHEAVHLALGQVEGRRADRLPRWFHEGAACWISGIRPLQSGWEVFYDAAAHDALLPFDKLTSDFPIPQREAQLAYLQSEAFIAHLAAEPSGDALKRILARYAAGEPFDAAFAETMGQPSAQIEKAWKDSLRRSFPWLRTLVRSLSFWAVMAFATIAVFLIIRRRARKQRQEWEREEEWSVVGEEEEEEPEEEEPEEEEEEEEDER